MRLSSQAVYPLGDGFEQFKAAHQSQYGLALLLEEIANRLPVIEPHMVRRALQILGFDLHIHDRDRREGLYPLLAERCGDDPTLLALLDQFAIDLGDRALRAEDLCTLLSAMLGEDSDYRGPEAAGYQLRAFFEGLSRQLKWEAKLLFPVVDHAFNANDRLWLAQAMEIHRNQGG